MESLILVAAVWAMAFLLLWAERQPIGMSLEALAFIRAMRWAAFVQAAIHTAWLVIFASQVLL